ncbi:MAG: ATP-binding protein [Magnetospirillum sp. WYHS-4]
MADGLDGMAGADHHLIGRREAPVDRAVEILLGRLFPRDAEERRLTDQGRIGFLIGNTGTGKSSIADQVFSHEQERETEHTIDMRSLPARMGGNRSIVVYDVPGNLSHASGHQKAWDAIFQHKVSGLINVVSYGFNETASRNCPYAPYSDEAKGIVDASYLEWFRADDEDFLRTWLDSMPSPEKIKWLVIAVNKHDLVYPFWERIKIHYGADSRYGQAVQNRLPNLEEYHVVPVWAGRRDGAGQSFKGHIPPHSGTVPDQKEAINNTFLDTVDACLNRWRA